jgi:NAD(P)-dependent dehydrogenase (short-subunit alcohol dehydrogenase family)
MSSHVIVVGGSKGLGLTVAGRFLDSGYEVTVLSRNPPEHGHERLRHIQVDLETLKNFSELDLSSIEGASPVRYLVLSQRYRGKGDAWEGEIQVGLTASRILIEGFLDFFAKDGDRAILAVSSVYAQFAGGSQPVGYHVVKGGLNAMVRYYAWALGPRGVRVNAILPLTFVQDRSRAFYESNEALRHMYERLVPLGRMGEAANNVDAIEFLCSERSAFINGQALFIDGGVSAIWQEQIAQSFSGA